MSYREIKRKQKHAREKKIEKIRRYQEQKRRLEEAAKEKDRQEKEKHLISIVSKKCQVDKTGKIPTTYLTSENYSIIKKAIEQLGITKIAQGDQLSQEEYCKIFKAYIFKKEKCSGKVCCQAITEEGTRCSRPASELFTVDLTERSLSPELPDFLHKHLTEKQIKELKLSGFAITCCFYCWQHAAMYGAEMLTWYSNITYYLTHPEDILDIFFENVVVRKPYMFIPSTYKYEVSKLRSPDEIIKRMFVLAATIAGKMTLFYWVIMAMVWLYDTLKPVLEKKIYGKISEIESKIQKMTVAAAKTLIKFNDLDRQRVLKLEKEQSKLIPEK